MFILRLCDSCLAPQEVSGRLHSLYPDVELAEIENDVQEILFTFSKNGLIDWGKEGNPFMTTKEVRLADGYSLALAGEEDIRTLIQFIHSPSFYQNALSYMNPLRDDNEYSDELLYRAKLFNYSEEFFLLKDNENRVKGVVSVLLPTQKKSTSCSFGLLSLDEAYLEAAWGMVKEVLPEIAVWDVSKIKFHGILQKHDRITELLEQMEFSKEGIFKQEIYHHDIEIVSYLY